MSATRPMLATLVDGPVDDPAWLYEPKLDGLRVIATFDGRNVTLLSRNGQPQNFNFPDVVEALRVSLKGPAVVDGEIVALDENGASSFRLLQQRFHLKDQAEVRVRQERYPAYLYLFDLLRVGRRDLRGATLDERKEQLRSAVRWSERIRYVEGEAATGSRLLTKACEQGQEGVIGKLRDSPYVGGRSAAWIKVKCIQRQEFVIVGYTDPQRSRVGLGALVAGYYDANGKTLHYAGKVGTGFDAATLASLARRLKALEVAASPLANDERPRAAGVHWVQPILVAEIAFAEWTQNGLLRQPRFEGLRLDKKPTQCRRERPQPVKSLATYRAKRDFAKTPEPGPVGKRSGKSRKGEPIFVVQEHHASHLHYDFRLEADGVLKSWAIPKEPKVAVGDKRLAVEVEDHPLSYATFAGDIPKGQYGGGHVDIWDHGTYEGPADFAAAHAAGKIDISLHGEKLEGRYALIRMGGRRASAKKPQWLLVKAKETSTRAKSSRAKSALASNVDKVMYPRGGITKGDVLEYYRAVAPLLLPFLKDRPVALERLPDGVKRGAPRFWQKNTPAYYPERIPRVTIDTERGRPVKYPMVNDLETLLYLVNQATLTFHPWLSRTASLDRPDFVLFDLDPGKASFKKVVKVAKALREILAEAGVDAYVKTSGKRGLHVLVPWPAAGQDGDFDAARDFASQQAHALVEAQTELATTEIRKTKREGRVYIDVMQNVWGHHVVPPYSLRTTDKASISMPVTWDELETLKGADEFTIANVAERLRAEPAWDMRVFARSERKRTTGRRMHASVAASRKTRKRK